MKHLIKIFCITTLFNCFAVVALSFPHQMDSLKYQYEHAQADSERFETLLVIDSLLADTSSQQAIDTWNSLIKISKQNDYYKGLGYSLRKLGILYTINSQYVKSYEVYEKSIENLKIINDKREMASSYNALAVLFKTLNKHEQALENFLISASLFSELNLKKEEAFIYSNLGGMFEEIDSLKQAKDYLNKSINILEEIDSIRVISSFINLGEVYESEGKYDSAFLYFNKSYSLSKYTDDENDRFHAPYHLGELYFEIGKTEKAKPFLNEALKIFRKEEEKSTLTLETKASFMKLMSNFAAGEADTAKAYLFLRKSNEYEVEYKKSFSSSELERQEFEKVLQESELEAQIQRESKKLILIVSILGLLASAILLIAIYRSYRDKQKANQLLREMDELKTRLYSNITHELRTPLTLILGPLEQMLSKKADKTPDRRQVKMMRKNAKSLLKLVNEMLDLAKIDAKSLKLEITECDIVKFTRTRFASFSSLARQKSISYEIRTPDKKFHSFTDTSKLEKIINNLVSNAIKFTPKNGTIRCTAQINANLPSLEITVEDTGMGIPESELNRIFDRFHQVKNNEASHVGGTGIGLTLTHELIHLMHGEIDVESTPGSGSIFKIIIPLGTDHLNQNEYIFIDKKVMENKEEFITEDEPEVIKKQNTTVTKSSARNLPEVLIAEDQIEIREFIEENLSENFSIKQAENGSIAFELATECIPDLIVTDLMMPEMDGIELCKKIKTDERTSHIPVIMLTGKSRLKDRLKGLETGADAYLTKPFSMKELKVRIKKLIEQRQKLRELFTHDLSIEPKDIAVTSADEKFLNRALEIIEKNMGNSDFEVRQFQEEMLMSRMQLFRKIKALTNQTPGEFIRTIRLKRAASLIKQNFGNIAQITYEVGFNNPSYFAKCFHDLYGVLPSQYN